MTKINIQNSRNGVQELQFRNDWLSANSIDTYSGGENKIQFHFLVLKGEWLFEYLTLSTKHFFIYFYIVRNKLEQLAVKIVTLLLN